MGYRYRKRFNKKRRSFRRIRKRRINKMMSIRRTKVELKYINNRSSFEVQKNSYGYQTITPLQIDQGTQNFERIGSRVKFRWLKLFATISVSQLIEDGNPDSASWYVPLRVLILKQNVSDQNLSEQLVRISNGEEPNGNFVKLVWQQQYTIVNPRSTANLAGNRATIEIKKYFRIPLNVTYDNSADLVNLGDERDKYILYVQNRMIPEEQNPTVCPLFITWRSRVTFIDS